MELSRLCHFLSLSDTPGDYWCKVPELENFTAAQRKILAIPLIDVSRYWICKIKNNGRHLATSP